MMRMFEVVVTSECLDRSLQMRNALEICRVHTNSAHIQGSEDASVSSATNRYGSSRIVLCLLVQDGHGGVGWQG